MYLNKNRIEPDRWTEIKVNDEICFGTPISKNSFRYTLEQLPDEDYQLVRVGWQTSSEVKKKCEGVSSIAEIVISTDPHKTESSSNTTNLNDNESIAVDKTAEAAVISLTDTEKTEAVAGSSGNPNVSNDSVTISKTTEAEGNSNQMMFSMQEEFLCVICQELFINAHVLSCSHSFCETCINDWLKKNNICPICRKKVEGKPIRSLVLDNAINKLVECMPEKDRNERASVLKDRAPKPEENQVILITDSPIRRVLARPTAVRPNRVNLLDSSDSDSNSNLVTSDSESDEHEYSPSDSDFEVGMYNGLPGFNWGGYGSCYRCGECYVLFYMYLSSHDPSTGDPYHWAPGCPN